MKIYNKLQCTTIWTYLSWKQIYERVFIIQQKIYKASKLCIKQDIYNTQNVLINSNEAKVIAIEKICNLVSRYYQSQSKEKYYFTNNDKFFLLRNLFKSQVLCEKLTNIVQKVRQYLIYLCIEPEWRAKFEPSWQKNNATDRDYLLQEKLVYFFYNKLNHQTNYLITDLQYIRSDLISKFIDINYLIKKMQSLPYINFCLKFWLRNQSFSESLNLQLFFISSTYIQQSCLLELLLKILLTGINWFNLVQSYCRYEDPRLIKHRNLIYSNRSLTCILDRNTINILCNIISIIFEAIGMDSNLSQLYDSKLYNDLPAINAYLMSKAKNNKIFTYISTNEYKIFLKKVKKDLYTKDILGRLRVNKHLSLEKAIIKVYKNFILFYIRNCLILSIKLTKKMYKTLNIIIYAWMKKKYRSLIIYNFKERLKFRKILSFGRQQLLYQISIQKNNR